MHSKRFCALLLALALPMTTLAEGLPTLAPTTTAAPTETIAPTETTAPEETPGRATDPMESGVPVELASPSAILVEAETGTIIFAKDIDTPRPVASLNKLMTLLLTFEALDAGELALDEPIAISREAAAQEGSQALLDAGAVYSLEELLKATIVASANDAACALAERLAGTEDAFAARMNERAAELGLSGTVFVNCTGLPRDGAHMTARDVATLSREVCRHAKYHEYASVWMYTLTHPSGRTTDMTNTNRLVRFYDGCDGLKTGSADAARYCLSATAEKNGMRLIAVVLGSSASQQRFNEARAMLNYGFGSYKRHTILRKGDLLGRQVRVRLGSQETVELAVGAGVSMLLKLGQERQLSLEVEAPEQVDAPVRQGDTLGMVRVLLNGRVVAKLPAVAATDALMPSLLEGFRQVLSNWR